MPLLTAAIQSIHDLRPQLQKPGSLTHSFREVSGVLLGPQNIATDGLTSLSTEGVAKEGRPKFNPQAVRELNPEPPGWQSEILSIALTSQWLERLPRNIAEVVGSNRGLNFVFRQMFATAEVAIKTTTTTFHTYFI